MVSPVMPHNNADRQRKHREKQKILKGEAEMKGKDRERKKVARQKNPYEIRAAERLRKAAKRAEKRSAEERSASGYSTPSSLGRAVRRTAASLPDSPSKRVDLDQLWGSAKAVPGTHDVHCVRAVSRGVISHSTTTIANGKPFNLLPFGRHAPRDHDGDAASSPSEEPREESEAHEEDVPPEGDSDSLSPHSITIQGGKWYAVYWDETQHWFIGQAVMESLNGTWEFTFIHQTAATANLFQLANDCASIPVEEVFLEVNAPAPASSSRTEILRLTEKDFEAVCQTFEGKYL